MVCMVSIVLIELRVFIENENCLLKYTELSYANIYVFGLIGCY